MKLTFSALFLIFLCCYLVRAQTPQTSTPFELHGDHLFIQLSIDGSDPLDFIFDTGDGLTVIDLDIAERLRLPLNHRKTTYSKQGTVSGAEIKHNSIAINGFMIEGNITVYATSLAHLEQSIGRNIDGIIGYDLLHYHGVRIDYDNRLFTIYPSGAAPKIGEPISIRLVNAMPVATSSFELANGEKLSGEFFVNTGAATTVDFNTPYANLHRLIEKSGKHYTYPVKDLANDETLHYEGRLASFTFAGQDFSKLPVGISQSMGGMQGDKKISGIVGNKLLQQFNISIDISIGKMYLQPRVAFNPSFMVNCSGLDLQMDKGLSRILVHKVIENSPAAQLGFKLNDEILEIDGQDAVKIGLVQAEQLLRQSGKSVTLKVKSGDDVKIVKLDLKELI